MIFEEVLSRWEALKLNRDEYTSKPSKIREQLNALFHKMAEKTRRTKKMKKLRILGHNMSHIDSSVLAKG